MSIKRGQCLIDIVSWQRQELMLYAPILLYSLLCGKGLLEDFPLLTRPLMAVGRTNKVVGSCSLYKLRGKDSY